MTDEPQILLVADVAKMFRCSVRTLYEALSRGSFPIAPLPRIDRKLRWSRQQVDAYLQQPGRVSGRWGRRSA